MSVPQVIGVVTGVAMHPAHDAICASCGDTIATALAAIGELVIWDDGTIRIDRALHACDAPDFPARRPCVQLVDSNVVAAMRASLPD